MKPVVARALLLDAFYQVLDNRIFRFLLLTVGLLVGLSFVFGFREDRIEVLWGWEAISYDDAFRFIGGSASSIHDLQAKAIGILQQLFADLLGGLLGVVFALAATAFFVPRSLEKGSADVLFSKPVSRAAVLFSRYLAGVMFVSFLAVALVGGLYLGFRLVSGYDDPGFLWTAGTIVYLFALLHGVSTLIGVVTRSTVAAILITLFFFVGTGCVHRFWRVRELARGTSVEETFREQGLEVPQALESDEAASHESLLVRSVLWGLEAAHWVLPKTSDAGLIATKLRRAVEARGFELDDPEGKLVLTRAPQGFARVPSGAAVEQDLRAAPARWESVDPARAAWIELSRRARDEDLPDGRTRRLTATRVARELEAELRASGRALAEPVATEVQVSSTSANTLAWAEQHDGARVERVTGFFTFGDSLFRVEAGASARSSVELAAAVDSLLQRVSLARDGYGGDPEGWYASRFGWDAPLRYNALFSIVSSLAFLVLMLLLACWRLSRIDF